MTSTEFSSETAYHVHTACQLAGLRSDDAKLVRFGENALFHLVSADVVVRVAWTLDYWDDVVNEVNVSRWLLSRIFRLLTWSPTWHSPSTSRDAR